MADQTVTRTLMAKMVRFAAGNRRDFSAPSIDGILRSILSSAETIGSRHWPDLPVPKDANRCFFIDKVFDRAAGVLFHICAYEPGHTPLGVLPDMDAEEADVQPVPMDDPDTGVRREVVTICRCLGVGDVLIIENVKGAGGVNAVSHLLTHLIRKYIDQKHPSMHLIDVANQELREAISRGGGVVEIVMDLAHSAVNDGSRYAQPLSGIRRLVRNTGLLRVSHRAKSGHLEDDDVIAAFEEAQEDDGLDKVTLRLHDSTVIDKLRRFKLRKPVTVTKTGDGSPNGSEIQRAMWDYLRELQELQEGRRILDEDGFFINLRINRS